MINVYWFWLWLFQQQLPSIQSDLVLRPDSRFHRNIYPRTFYLHLETWSSENLKVFLHLPKNMMLFAGTVSTLGLLQKLWWRMSSSERLTRFSYKTHCFPQIMSSTLVTCLPIPHTVIIISTGEELNCDQVGIRDYKHPWFPRHIQVPPLLSTQT